VTPADKRLTRGIYKRKNSYWLNVQKDNKRTFISLRTSDLAVAIRKAAQIRHSPQITSGLLLQNCVERFVHAKRLARERGARKGWAWRSALEFFQQMGLGCSRRKRRMGQPLIRTF